MVRRTEQGSWQHGAPTGYDCIRDADGRPTLKTNKYAPLMRKVLQTFNTGLYTVTKLTKYTEDIGLLNKKSKPFGKQTITNWLKNPVYAGLVNTNMVDQAVIGIHEGLITPEQFNENQLILSGKKKDYAVYSTTNEYPLKANGFILCAFCNHPLTASATKGNGGKYPRYSCSKCKASLIKKPVSALKDNVHNEFIELSESVSPSKAVLKLFEAVLIKEWNSRYQESKEMRRELEKNITELEAFKRRARDKYINEELPLANKEKVDSESDEAILALQMRISELKEEEIDVNSVIKYATAFLGNTAKLWKDAPFEQKVWFQKLVFSVGIKYEFGKGFRTAKLGVCYRVINDFANDKSTLVGPVGFEPTTNQL